MAWAAVFLCSDPWFFFSSFLCRALAPTLSHSSAFSTSAGVFWFCVLCFDDACETGLHQLNGLSGSTCFTFSSCLCLMFLLLLACFGCNFFFFGCQEKLSQEVVFCWQAADVGCELLPTAARVSVPPARPAAVVVVP